MKNEKKRMTYKAIQDKKEKREKYYKILSLVIFFIVWECIGRMNIQYGWMEPKFLPAPTQIFESAYTMMIKGILPEHLGISLFRVIGGYLIGCIVSVILGSLIANFKICDIIVSPVLNLVGPIPVMAFLPMFILWFGIGEQSKLILIAYATVIYMIPYVVEGIRNTDPLLIRSAVSLGATKWQVFKKVKFQSTFPNIFLGMKGALGVAFGAMVVAEMLGASTGLGYIIVFSKNWFKMEDMMMAAILIGLLYSVLFGMLTVMEKRLFRWKKEASGNAIEK